MRLMFCDASTGPRLRRAESGNGSAAKAGLAQGFQAVRLERLDQHYR